MVTYTYTLASCYDAAGVMEIGVPLKPQAGSLVIGGPSADDWADLKENGPDGAVGHFGKATQGASRSDEIGKEDTIDYMAFDLDSAAKLSFRVTTGNAAKFVVYELVEKIGRDGKSTYSLKALQSVSLKAGTITTPGLLLNAGTYYFSIAATDKKAGNAPYTVAVDSATVYFTKGDNSDDWGDVKANGAAGQVGRPAIAIDEDTDVVRADWVGYGDAVDYRAFTLESAANLAFDLAATDAAKLTVWSLTGAPGKYSLKSLGNVTAKLNKATGEYTGSTKALLLEQGTYYFSVESTNAKKGGNADYSVSLNGSSTFFIWGDTNDDTPDNLVSPNVDPDYEKYVVGEVGSALGGNGYILDDWVGYGDVIDYRKFTLDHAASLVFDLSATDAAKLTVWSLTGTPDKYSLKSLGNVAAKLDKATGKYAGSTKALLLEKGTYFFSVESTNAKKGGSAFYSVYLNGNSAVFTAGDNSDDGWADAPALAPGEALEDWVGFGDAVDFRKVSVAETGGFYSFDLAGAESALKLTVYTIDTKGKLKSLKSISVNAKKPALSTGPIALAEGGTYYLAVEATGAKKGESSGYTATVNELGVFTGTGNNAWENATAAEYAFEGCLGKGGDTVDYFDLTEWGENEFSLVMETGSVKASFFDASKKAVKVPVTYANDTTKSAASLTLKDGDKLTDMIRLAAVDESVKYLKIEAAGSAMVKYNFGMLA